jgi:hypothetical protein
MLTLFWDERGVILGHYMPRGNNVTSATYADLLKNHVRPAIKFKRRGRLSTGVLLQHGNARPHTARSTVATIQHVLRMFSTFAVLARPRPSDIHVFGLLKGAMGSKSFRSDEETKRPPCSRQAIKGEFTQNLFKNADVNSKYFQATEKTIRDFHRQSSSTLVRKPTIKQNG